MSFGYGTTRHRKGALEKKDIYTGRGTLERHYKHTIQKEDMGTLQSIAALFTVLNETISSSHLTLS
jgi:hypothetical protein